MTKINKEKNLFNLKSKKFHILTIILLTVIVFFNILQNNFIWDDDDYIYKNRLIQTPEGLLNIWKLKIISYDPLIFKCSTPQYYPVVFTCFYLEHAIWGLNPAAYHAVSLLMHTANAILLYLVLQQLGFMAIHSWFVSLIFAIHPVQVETVAWATEMKNILSVFFYLMTFYLILRLYKTKKTKFGYFSIITYILALLSKTISLTLPAAILAGFYIFRKKPGKKVIIFLAIFLVSGSFMGFVTSNIEKHHVGSHGSDWELDSVQRIVISCKALIFYFLKIIFPHPVSFIYPRWNPAIDSLWKIYPVFAITGFGVIILYLFLKNVLPAQIIFGFVFAVITLSPALGFVDFYPMKFSFVADHFQYLACTGFIISMVFLFDTFIRKDYLKLIRVFCIILVLSLGIISFKECKKYRNQETLWNDTLKKNPDCWLAYNNLGVIYRGKSQLKKSEEYFKKVLEFRPYDPEPYNNFGELKLQQGGYEASIKFFDKAIEISPDFSAAYNNKGFAFFNLNEIDRAITMYQKALTLTPDFAEAYGNLGIAFIASGNNMKAEQSLNKAMKLFEVQGKTKEAEDVRLLRQNFASKNVE